MQDVLGEKLVDGGSGQIKREHLKHQMFHSQHLLLGVGVVGDVNKLRDLWGVDLLKLPAWGGY